MNTALSFTYFHPGWRGPLGTKLSNGVLAERNCVTGDIKYKPCEVKNLASCFIFCGINVKMKEIVN